MCDRLSLTHNISIGLTQRPDTVHKINLPIMQLIEIMKFTKGDA